jgi:hypothetical protein
VLQTLKKYYDKEPQEVQNAIVWLSQAMRKHFKEINTELPL